MENDSRAEARKRVQDLFIDRVDQAGMGRPKKVTVAEHGQFKSRLVEHLAYLSEANLLTLAELVIDAGQGTFKVEWPPEAAVRALAHGLETPPVQEHRIITSWLASIEGPQAVDGGFEVELYLTLRKTPKPPNSYVMGQIRERARENARRVELVRSRVERGVVSDEDRNWLEWYQRTRANVRRIIERGQQKREVQA